MAREPDAIVELRRALGTRLATFRLAAELTQGQLAKLAICDRTSIVHIEKGRGRGDERFWRTVDDACDAGGVLLAAYAELEAAKSAHERREHEQRLAAVRAEAAELREKRERASSEASPDGIPPEDTVALRFLPDLASGLSDAMLAGSHVRAGDLPTLTELTNRVRQAWQLRQRAAYAKLGGQLAGLIPDIETSAANSDGDERSVALTLVVHTYNAASSLLKRLGDIELALLAADRAVRAARSLGDSLLVAAAAYRLANVLLTASRLRDARNAALGAADSVGPGKTPSPLGLASWGGLLLTGAVASARMGDRSGAWELLGEARTASRLLGVEYADIHTIFGPTNVAIHGVQVAAELGDGQDAVRRGERVDLGRLPASLHERRGQFLIDWAQGQVLTGSDGAAVDTLSRAEKAAPEEVRFNPTAHRLMRVMLGRERFSATPGLRGLAGRIGVDA